ncbi:MAG: class I SAM-dependent methyltransferase [Nanoarchaeota archaeon]|nr:class I SAM-dependent methyltransferase [Nanoarchaeota archaeon]
MVDIEVYSHQEDYMKFQNLRPDYIKAITVSLDLAKKYVADKEEVILADFCCGTGSNSKEFASLLNGLRKVILVDINGGFLEIAKKSGIKSKDLILQESDILEASFLKECNIVLSIFAYHHVPDEKKQLYINKIKECLKDKGILVLTEIYFNNKNNCMEYYKKLFESIPSDKTIPGLKKFLQQTAESSDFEFKVSKDYADKQFEDNGFTLLHEEKIWSNDDNSDEKEGTFVQIYRL